MKKGYTTIAVLLTISLMGLIYLQISWIRNTLLLQRGRYANDLELAFRDIKIDIQDAISNQVGMKPDVLDWDGDDPTATGYLWSKISDVPTTEMTDIITRQLAAHNIHLPFEYMIEDPSPWKLITSPGFRKNMIAESYSRPLSFDGSYTLYLYIRIPANYLYRSTIWMIIISMIFTVIVIFTFYITFRTILRQKKVSEMKTDFINNMTHEFKTPMATISLAADALGFEKVKHNEQQLDYYTRIIKEENSRMHKQVQRILETARADRKTLQINPEEVDAHEVISLACDNIAVRMANEEGVIDQFLNAEKHTIFVDEVHFSNIITNLLENAVKYSKPPVHISVETKTGNSKNLIIKIKDSGIGMSKETVQHIFEKFYRAHTGDLHDVKGFGLGLSYVKTVVDAHHAKIKVDSTLGKGTTFTLDFPFKAKGLKTMENDQ